MDVIVVQKLAKLDVLRREGEERVERLRAVDASLLERLEASAERHHEARERVVDELTRLGFGVRSVSRDAFDGPGVDAAIVIAVGGDGTVLDVSHRVEGVPLLGVNSDPGRSRGYFCGTDIDGFAETIRRWRDREAETVTLRRMSIWLDGERVPYPCLNDVLVANNNPAMMSRYVISAGTRSEVQASSGVWISTPAGSTAGIRSAGGTVLPLDGDMLQYLVREPYVSGPHRFELSRGVRHLGEGLTVRSLMEGGALFIDGPYLTLPFPTGSEMSLRDGPTLELVAMDPHRRER